MATEDRYFEIPEGLMFSNGGIITGGADSPQGVLDLPAGSFYIQNNGELWVKDGEATNDWVAPLYSKTLCPPEAILQAANINSGNNTGFHDTDLVIPVEANDVVWFDACVLFSSSSTNNGIGFQFTGPNGGAFKAQAYIPTNNTTGLTFQNHYNYGLSLSSTGVGTSGRVYMSTIQGYVINGANAGAVMVRFRGNSVVNSTTLYANSSLTYTKKRK